MRILWFNLAMDAEDPILGFATYWVRAMASRVEVIHVISMRAGRGEVPDNVRVYSVGKERVGPAVDKPFATELDARTKREGLTSTVTFVGALPPEDVAREMSGAAAVVAPSRSEALPRVVLEALAAGAPVIATGVGGMPEIVAHGVTGILVLPEDADALATALAGLLADDDLRGRLLVRGRDSVQALLEGNYFLDGYRHLLDASVIRRPCSAQAQP